VRGLLPARLMGELSLIEPVLPSKRDDFISETTSLDLNMSAEECKSSRYIEDLKNKFNL